MIVVDTSVWISFFKGEKKSETLQQMIIDNQIAMHPYVYGELMLGGISLNAEHLLKSIPEVPLIENELIYFFITENKIKSKGIGWVDVNILASALSANYKIYTFDENLLRICREFNCNYH